MDLEEYAKDQLSYIYDRISSDEETRSKIKNWCITVWIGSLAAANSIHLTHLLKLRTALPFLPIPFFWTLDVIYQIFISWHREHARTLERMLLGLEAIAPGTLKRNSLESGSGHNRHSFKNVIATFLKVPTIVFFYGPMIVVTVVVYWSLS